MHHKQHTLLTSFRFLLVALLAFTGLLPLPLAAEDTDRMIVLVRHAEKQADGNDPCLTDAGHDRAKRLAHHLSALPVRHLFSTDYCRTRETLGVLASDHELAIRFYEPEDSAILLDATRQDAGVTVVAAHSNTLSLLLRDMGFDINEISEDEYDHLFLVTFTGAEPERLIHLKY